MKLGPITICLSFFIYFPAQAEPRTDEAKTALLACYERADALETKYECYGRFAKQCADNPGENSDDYLIPCINSETETWREIGRIEFDMVKATFRQRDGTSGACKPSTEACIALLYRWNEDTLSKAERRCEYESLPENSAGFPELALAACTMREMARRAILLRKHWTEMP